jgi:hypothetical protein
MIALVWGIASTDLMLEKEGTARLQSNLRKEAPTSTEYVSKFLTRALLETIKNRKYCAKMTSSPQ